MSKQPKINQQRKPQQPPHCAPQPHPSCFSLHYPEQQWQPIAAQLQQQYGFTLQSERFTDHLPRSRWSLQLQTLAVKVKRSTVPKATNTLIQTTDLATTAEPYALALLDHHSPMRPFIVDFVNGTQGYRRRQAAGKKQLIARACGIKQGQDRPHILDACAGFGYDAMTLAKLGCQLTLVEQHPVVAALLQDALRRLADHDPQLAARLKLVYNSAENFLQKQQQAPYFSTQAPPPQPCSNIVSANNTVHKRPTQPFDVIYLDPMFPAQSHSSALVKKEMQILRLLNAKQHAAPCVTQAQGNDALLHPTACHVHTDEIHHDNSLKKNTPEKHKTQQTPRHAPNHTNEKASEALFSLAKKNCRRLVVKRPSIAGYLLDHNPDLIYQQRQHRFDVYLQR